LGKKTGIKSLKKVKGKTGERGEREKILIHRLETKSKIFEEKKGVVLEAPNGRKGERGRDRMGKGSRMKKGGVKQRGHFGGGQGSNCENLGGKKGCLFRPVVGDKATQQKPKI